MSHENGTLTKVDPQPPADLLGDLLGPLAIEGPPSTEFQSQQTIVSGLKDVPDTIEAAAIVPFGEQINSVQVLLTVIMRLCIAYEEVG